ncbi:MAG: PKD domain-containing protein, partial [Bacteroidales bacterium]
YEALNSNCSQYDWIVEGGTIISGQNTPKVEVSWGSPESGYGTIGLDGTLCNDMCHSIMSVKIPIISSHTIISGQEEVCQGETIKYGLPLWGSTNYQWTVSPSQGVNIHYGDNINEIMLEFITPGTYTLNSTYECEFIDCGPLTSPTKTIEVKPVLAIVSEDNNICAGNIGTFSTDANVSVTWRVLNQNNQQINTTTQSATLNYQFNTVGSYIVKAENPNYCNVASFAVRVNGKPTALTAGMIEGETTACPNSSVMLSLQPTANIDNCHLEWSPVCSTAAPQTGIGDNFTVTFAQQVCGVNVFKVDNVSGCKSDPYLYNITEFSLNPSNLPTSKTVCPGEVITLSCPEQEGVFYEWLVAPEERATVIDDKTSPSVNVLINYMANGNYPQFNINLKRTYCNTLSSITPIQINVIPQATAPTLSWTHECSKHSIAFTATGGSNNPANYTWVIDGETYEGVNPAHHIFNTGGDYNIQLTYTPDNTCDPVTVTQTIHIFDSPTITIGIIGTTLTGYIIIDNDNPSGLNYSPRWSTPDGQISGYSCTTTTPGMYCFSLTNPNTGCFSSKCYNHSGNNCINDITFSNPIYSCNEVILTASSPYNLAWNTDGEVVLSNNTHTATITYDQVGQHLIYVYATNSSPDCHIGHKTVTIPYIPDFRLSYDCSTHRLKIEDKSKYYPASNQQTRVLHFTITGGYSVTIGAGQMEAFVNIPLPQASTTYTVTLNHLDCTLQKSIDLHPSPTITSMTHSGPNPTQLCEKVPFLFTATTTGAPNLKYYWDFGDGATGKYNNIYHTFAKNDYPLSVILTVTDNNGCVATDSRIFNVFQNNAIGNINFAEGYENDVCPGAARVIEYKQDPNPISTYIWNPANSIPNSYQFTTYYTGNYEVKVESNIGCIAQMKKNVRFLNKPYAYISAQTKYCVGETVELKSIMGPNYVYNWTVTGPNGQVTLNNPDQSTTSFTAQTPGDYTATLVVSIPGECSSTVSHNFHINPNPPAPNLIFGGNFCIHTPPVILQDQNNNSVYWNIGIHSNIANYYTPGFATAYNIEPTTGCKSDDAKIFIEPAPNFDALLTGCYKKCVPDNLDVYGLSTIPVEWKWYYNSQGMVGGNGNTMSLPIPFLGTYYLEAGYNNNNCYTSSPTLTIEQADNCGCDGISITSNEKDNCYIKECKVFYQTSVIICNNSGSTITFDQLTAMTGINIVSANVIPLTLTNGQCDYIQIDFEITNPSVEFANFSLYSSQNDCLKTFSVNIDLSECMTDPCEVELKEFNFIDNMEGSLVFDFVLGLPNNPNVVYSVWTEPDRIHFYNLNLPYIDGIAMFDYGELTQLVANGEEVCFYVLMCIDDQICKAKVCIKAAELLSMSGSKSKSKTNTTQTNTQTKIDKDSPYLVPNPAETYVTIEGIEPTNITEVFLIDITGKKLKVISNNNTLDINDIPSGTYFVRVMNKSQKAYYLKLIKK